MIGLDEMSDKLFITAQGLLEDSFRLGARVLSSGFRPTFIVAIWRGGAPIGTAVQEFLQYFGIQTDHIAIRTSSYQGIDGRSSTVRIHGTSYLIKNIEHDDRLLIVDDVFDTGQTIRALVEHLREKARRNTPGEIRVAVPYYKPTRNQTELVPDYYLHETDRWIKFPYSLEGLSVEEIREHRSRIYEVIERVLPAARE
jgi:hypoxanthine phosphoribosyltransferase